MYLNNAVLRRHAHLMHVVNEHAKNTFTSSFYHIQPWEGDRQSCPTPTFLLVFRRRLKEKRQENAREQERLEGVYAVRYAPGRGAGEAPDRGRRDGDAFAQDTGAPQACVLAVRGPVRAAGAPPLSARMHTLPWRALLLRYLGQRDKKGQTVGGKCPRRVRQQLRTAARTRERAAGSRVQNRLLPPPHESSLPVPPAAALCCAACA